MGSLLGKVRKPQKPGRKDLLGVNIAFSFKIKFSSLRFFHRYHSRHKARIKAVF